MPDHATWFDYLLPGFEGLVSRFRQALGLSYIEGVPPEIQYVIGFAFIGLLLLILALIARRRIVDTEAALVPDGSLTLRSFFEIVIEVALNAMTGLMDRRAALFALPLIGSSALVILFSNLLGLIPGFLAPTSNLNTTVAMAMVIFLATHVYGVRRHGLRYFAHFLGPVRAWYALPLMLLMLGIEIVSHVARPVSLSLRLAGNMFADHLVLVSFAGLFPLLLPVPMLILGVIICLVQVLVFCLLSMTYIGMAVSHEEH